MELVFFFTSKCEHNAFLFTSLIRTVEEVGASYYAIMKLQVIKFIAIVTALGLGEQGAESLKLMLHGVFFFTLIKRLRHR